MKDSQNPILPRPTIPHARSAGEKGMITRPALWLLAFIVTPGMVLYAAAAPPGRSKKQAKAAHVVSAPAGKPGNSAFERDIAPLMKQFCAGCHGGSSPAAGISLARFKDTASVLKARTVWERVAKNIGD